MIQVFDGELLTKLFHWNVSVGQEIHCDVGSDILKIAVVNRYNSNAKVVTGFVRGFGLKRGALASSIAHDSHNVVVVGTSEEAMVKAAQMVFDCRGALVVATDDNVLVHKLPIAGLMADQDCEEAARSYSELVDAAKRVCQCSLSSPFMTMGFMSLLVIPQLKIGDKGLFDAQKFQFVDLF